MNAETYVDAVRDDLANVAAVGDEATARAAGLLTTALEPSLQRRLQEALVEAALELSAQLDRGRVEVRVGGDELDLVYVDGAESQPEAAEEAPSARISLRLPDSVKTRIEAAATARGVSVNTWLVQTLTRALDPPLKSGGGVSRHRLTGYGRS